MSFTFIVSPPQAGHVGASCAGRCEYASEARLSVPVLNLLRGVVQSTNFPFRLLGAALPRVRKEKGPSVLALPRCGVAPKG